MTYDSLDRLTRTTYPDTLFETATYDAAGRVLTKTDREGNITSSWYDSAGNLVKVVSPSDTVTYTYDSAGQRIKAQNGLGSISYVFDPRGRIIQETEIIGTNTYTLRFGYDAVGNTKWVLYPDGTNVTYGYDAYDRVTTVTKAPSTTLLTLTYNLDDSVATETTGPSTSYKLVTTYTYDNRDRPTKMETKQGTKVKLSLQYTYDGVGNRLTKVEGGTTSTYTYGVYNLLLGEGAWTYRYDPNLNLNWKNNTANTVKWNYQWNSLNQLTKAVKLVYDSKKKVWTSSTIGEYYYDANGARARAVESGVDIERNRLSATVLEGNPSLRRGLGIVGSPTSTFGFGGRSHLGSCHGLNGTQ